MSCALKYRGPLPLSSLFPALACVLLWAAQPSPASAHTNGQEVELNLTIQSGAAIDRYQEFFVDLRDSSGESIRIIGVLAGDKAHFKHLKPNIYLACIQGWGIPKTCKSIDAFPPVGAKECRFDAEIAIPPSALNIASLHTVSIKNLQTPEKAKQELLNSLQDVSPGNLQKEIVHLQKAIEIDPDYADALNNLGYCYHLAGNEALSIEYLRKVTELEPGFHVGWANLAGSLLSSGRWEEALDAASRAMTIVPDSVSSNSQVAYCYFQMQRYPDAEKYFKRVLELDPASCSFPMLSLAVIALMDDRQADAEAYVHLFLKIHPNYPFAPRLLAKLQIPRSDSIRQAVLSLLAQK